MPVEMYLESMDGKVNMKIEALTANRVTGDMRAVDWRKHAKKWKHLANIAFPTIGPRPIVDILIGIDYADLHRSLEEVIGAPGEPIARRTPLGWTCIGALQQEGSRPYKSNFIQTYRTNDAELTMINQTLEKLWEVEEMKTLEEPVISKEDKAVLDQVSSTLMFKDGKYKVKYPWKTDRQLPNN